jgi:hypothetical protein
MQQSVLGHGVLVGRRARDRQCLDDTRPVALHRSHRTFMHRLFLAAA